MNWWCYNIHSFELSRTRVQHYLEIFLFRSNSRWEGNFCYTWYKRSRCLSLNFSFSFKKWIYNVHICGIFSTKKNQIYSQNGHKLNHMFQKLLFHKYYVQILLFSKLNDVFWFELQNFEPISFFYCNRSFTSNALRATSIQHG